MKFDLAVIGQGYVGLPLAKEATLAGLKVVGVDANDRTVAALNNGSSHVDDIVDSELQDMIRAGYAATSDPSVLGECDTIVICVPTPLAVGGAPDLDAVLAATRDVAANMRLGTLVVLESTTYPGTTENVVKPILEENGSRLDRDFFLAFSPERIDPGNPVYGLRNTPKVVGGASAKSTERAASFYAQFVEKVVPVKGTREAETSKLLENTYRHINIALVNEMAKFCHELDIDLWDVIDAAKTKPFGFQEFYPGPGVGGHCIPIDPNYLSYEVRKSLNYPFRFVELAEEINNSMPRYVVQRIQALLNDVSKPLRGARVLLLGVTYKANIADQRESPATEIAEDLIKNGSVVAYHDPFVSRWNSPGVGLDVVTDLDAATRSSDIVVLLQAHSVYDVDEIAKQCELFLDTRGKVSHPGAFRL